MGKEQGLTNIDARWLWELSERMEGLLPETAAALRRIARNLQSMDEKLVNLENRKDV